MKKLDGKVTIITGAGSGFGRASALLFAGEGAKVVVADINDAAGEETVAMVRKAGGTATFVHVDCSSAADAERATRETLTAFGKIDVLFANAGIANKGGPVEEISEKDWDRVYDTNVKGTFLMAKYAIPKMKEAKGGVIVITASIAGVRPRPMAAAYNSSKAAAIGLTKCLAVELAPSRIRVNCLNPVMADTGLIRSGMAGMSEEAVRQGKERVASGIPLGRLAEPDDIAKAALFLASDDSSFITGEEIYVDGGRALL